MEPLITAQAIESLLSKSKAELVFHSSALIQALKADLGTFTQAAPRDPTGSEALEAASRADTLFNSLRIPVLFGPSPTVQIRLWELILGLLRRSDETRYSLLHKGTPFYFLGIASYMAEDFERALYYVDCALSEDFRLHGSRWHRVPSGMFVRLDSIPESQFGRSLVHEAQGQLDRQNNGLVAHGATPLSLDSYRARLVNRAMQSKPALRSVVTAFLSFMLERQSRRTLLELAPAEGSGEPFFLHLFKGGLLFETLLKASDLGAAMCVSKPRATLKSLLVDDGVTTALGLSRAVQGLGSSSFDQLLERVEEDEAAGRDFATRAIRAAWGIRNVTGHNVAWPRRPTTEEYDRLFMLLYGSLAIVLDRLYAPELLENGAA